VEVLVYKYVSEAGYLPPLRIRVFGLHFFRQVLDGFSYYLKVSDNCIGQDIVFSKL